MELSKSHQLLVAQTLNVQAVEDELTALWAENAHQTDDEGAVIRARVLNLIAYVENEETLKETDEIVFDIAAVHPCRSILLLGQKEKASKDIEAFVSSRCHLPTNGGRRHLCIEQVTMCANGDFVAELPSAALPLLVPDLHSFLWWRGKLDCDDAVFKKLARGVDRVVIDSASMRVVKDEMANLSTFFKRKDVGTISDLNWARLTEWRSIIASLFDSPEHRSLLNQISDVEIGYLSSPKGITAKALLLVGWLASHLGWRAVYTTKNKFIFEKNGEEISVNFAPIKEQTGDSSFIKIVAGVESPTTFSVSLNKEACYFDANVCVGKLKTSTTFASKKADEAGLLITELNLLHRDKGYEKTVAAIVEMFQA